MVGLTITEDDANAPDTNQRRARLWVSRMDALLAQDLPFYKIGIAHLACGLFNNKSRSGYKSDKCTNPEQLFACAYAVCYHSALKLILKKKHLPFDDTRVDIAVNLNARDNGHFLSVDIDVYIPGVDKEKAKNAIHLAHEICPYSKAIRNNVDVTFNVVDS
jgi:Ohr subfamily peroxiredoxin